MQIRRAVILAAGNGGRLSGLTPTRPKPLLEVGGRTLIGRQVETLLANGVRHIAVVVGYQESSIRAHLGSRVVYVRNDRYRETNSLFSLWLASQHLNGGAFVVNGDVFFSPLLLERLKWHPAPDALLFDPRRSLGNEEMKVRMAGPYVVDVSKELRSDLAAGQSVGLLKFGPEGAARLTEVLEQLVTAGEVSAWAPRAVSVLAHRWPVVGVDSDGLPWTEVNDRADLDYANRVVAPAIDASVLPIRRQGAPAAATSS